MSKTLLVMAGGTGGHIFGSGRAARLTSAKPRLACAEDMADFPFAKVKP